MGEKILTAKKFFEEIEENPDLNRLGPYTVNEKVWFMNKSSVITVMLGEGTFNEVFSTYSSNLKGGLHLGTSTFNKDVNLETKCPLFTGKAVFNGFVSCGTNENLAKMLFYHIVGRVGVQLPLNE